MNFYRIDSTDLSAAQLNMQDAMAREIAAALADDFAEKAAREEQRGFPTVAALHRHTAGELRTLTRKPIKITDGDWIYTTTGEAWDGAIHCENLRLPGVGIGADFEAATLDLLDRQNDF